MKFSRILTVFSLTAILAAFAQENVIILDNPQSSNGDGAYISLGLTYRNFDKPKFKSSGISGSDAYYYNGRRYALNQLGQQRVTNGSGAQGNFVAQTVTVVESNGGHYSSKGSLGTNDKLAPVIGIGYNLSRQGSLVIDLVGNFAYFNTDSSSRKVKSSGFATDSYTALVANGRITPYIGGQGGGSYGDFDGSFKAKYEMKLYQFDLGASLGYALANGLQLNLAVGPTLAFADTDSSCTAYYDGEGGKRSDDSFKSIFGVYASAGLSYWFTEQLGLSCDFRYDEAFKDAKTKYVTQDLDSWSAGVRVLWHF